MLRVSFPTFVPSNKAIIPFIITPASQWDMSVQIPKFLNLSLILCFQDQVNQFSRFCLLRTSGPSGTFWIFFWIFRLPCFAFLLSPALLDHDLLWLPFLPLPLRGVAWTLQSLSKQAPPPVNNHLVDSMISMGSDCPRVAVPLDVESRIFKPNFASTYVTISRRASSNSSWVSSVSPVLQAPMTHDQQAWSHRPTYPASSSRSETRRPLSVRSPLGVPEESTLGETIVCRRFRFLPPVVGSYRFCSPRHASDGFFRELATMSFASQLTRAMSAVCICCNTSSRFCTSLSTFVSLGRNSRSIAVVVISVACSAAPLQQHLRVHDHTSCCNTNSRLCTHCSTFVEVGRISR